MDQVEVSLNFLAYQYLLSISLHHKNTKGSGRHGFSYIGFDKVQVESKRCQTNYNLCIYAYNYLYRYILLTPTTAKVQKFIVHLQLFILEHMLTDVEGNWDVHQQIQPKILDLPTWVSQVCLALCFVQEIMWFSVKIDHVLMGVFLRSRILRQFLMLLFEF